MRVDADEAYNTSHAVSNDAEELRDELAALQRQWDNLSRGWTRDTVAAQHLHWCVLSSRVARLTNRPRT